MIILNWLLYIFILMISVLPFWLLYRVSDILFVILYYLIPYRKKVVLSNLKNSFPEKTDAELQAICFKFYRHLCDLMVETFKTFTMSESQFKKRFKLTNPDFIKGYHDRNKSLIGISGHYGNWEWAALAIGLDVPHKTMGIYTPLSNKFFNNVMLKTRGRFGLHLTAAKQVRQFFKTHENDLTFSGFIADQAPVDVKKCHWMDFLNQDTPVFFGAERYAIENNFPVLFGLIKKVGRGRYELTFEVVSDDPSSEPHAAITEKHVRILERAIREEPAYWLWTHKRWKRSRPKPEQS